MLYYCRPFKIYKKNVSVLDKCYCSFLEGLNGSLAELGVEI